MKKNIFIALFVIHGFITSAQNNPIFQGGSGDGINSIPFAQAGNNIFTGGTGDGWNAVSYLQAANNIFTGGAGDGWHNTTFLQAGNSIFNGGEADGWNATSFSQAGNQIFIGGEADGWNNTSFLQPGNDIFTGGEGDGWSSTYRPMGTIPVNFLYFNAQKQGETASLLNWKTSQEINAAFFDVERSTDAVNFSFIGRVAATGNSQVPVEYFYTDNDPATGMNYYRLKQVDLDGRFIYTPARLLRFAITETGNVKYFPNPTNGILQIELPVNMLSEARIITISNAAGMVLNQLKSVPSTNQYLQLDLGRYPKGVYFIHVKAPSVNSTQRIVLQ